MNQITRPGMYARKIGITQPITGPSAASSSLRHGFDTQMLNATQANVRAIAIANRTVGRSPEAGAARLLKPPCAARGGSSDTTVPATHGDLVINQCDPRLIAGHGRTVTVV